MFCSLRLHISRAYNEAKEEGWYDDATTMKGESQVKIKMFVQESFPLRTKKQVMADHSCQPKSLKMRKLEWISETGAPVDLYYHSDEQTDTERRLIVQTEVSDSVTVKQAEAIKVWMDSQKHRLLSVLRGDTRGSVAEKGFNRVSKIEKIQQRAQALIDAREKRKVGKGGTKRRQTVGLRGEDDLDVDDKGVEEGDEEGAGLEDAFMEEVEVEAFVTPTQSIFLGAAMAVARNTWEPPARTCDRQPTLSV